MYYCYSECTKNQRIKIMKTIYIFATAILLFSGCGPVTIKNPPFEKQASTDSVNQSQILNDTLLTDSIQNIQAFGDLYFGMKKNEVEQKNEETQLLGKFNYNFSYEFNGDSALYKVIIQSDGKKVIEYDTSLKNSYINFLNIVETRYGKPFKHSGYPSVFDVQQVKKYKIDEWETDNKQIQISLRENAMNSF